MSLTMRSLFPLALVAIAAPALGAQSIFDSELRLAPQFIQYQFKSPSNETVSELAVPVFVRIPLGSSLNVDVGTSYARARSVTGGTVSEINGLTDTQVRGNLTLGNDFIVLTGGLNLPTGRSSVTVDQLTAAGRIASDFLAFPINSLGTGLAFTGGIAIAQPLGDWSLGFGGAMRHSTSYEPFNVPGQSLHFQPGDEYRARVGVDHGFGVGRVSLGLTYSAFGNDDAGGSVYHTGNRLIAQALATNTYAGTDVTMAAYNVFRGSGTFASGDPAGRENILNGYLGVGLHVLGTIVEPNVEGRHWLQNVPASTAGSVTAERSQSSYLATFGLRTRIDGVGLSLFPSAGFTVGQLATVNAASVPTHANLTGFRAQLAVRFGP